MASSTPAGILIAGRPARLAGTVITSWAYATSGSILTASSLRGATDGAVGRNLVVRLAVSYQHDGKRNVPVGVRSMSTRVKVSANSCWMPLRTDCALPWNWVTTWADTACLPITMRRCTSALACPHATGQGRCQVDCAASTSVRTQTCGSGGVRTRQAGPGLASRLHQAPRQRSCLCSVPDCCSHASTSDVSARKAGAA